MHESENTKYREVVTFGGERKKGDQEQKGTQVNQL